MGKSLGNVIDLTLRRGARASGRSSCATTCAAPHYRSRIDYSEEALREAAVAYRRIEGFVQRAAERSAPGRPGRRCRPGSSRRWTTTSTPPRRSPSCTTLVREGNTALAEGDDRGGPRRPSPPSGRCWTSSGLDPLAPQWAGGGRADDLRGWSTRWSRSRWSSAPRPAAARTGPPPTRCATSSSRPASSVEDTPAGPRWTLESSD